MTSIRHHVLWIVLACLFTSCQQEPAAITQGSISGSQTFEKSIIVIEELTDSVYLDIEGDNIILDFSGSTLDARQLHKRPDRFRGIALRISNSVNVEIRNLNVHGFRYAIFAENVDSLKIINCNFNYNYRPRLNSKWDKESIDDWLYFHNNENNEWLRYAGAVYLKRCDEALVKSVTIQQGFNGLMMDRCSNGLIYNNDFRFNSGLGIGMYRSSSNRIMHNRLDWNVRGYSHGKYDRGQDSAGILLYEQCNDNIIAYNSATHSGDGLFLWAGQHTMDTGTGGCNRNIIYRNDFSHSVANGVEATFSSNFIIENKLNDCRYGVWAGYSHNTSIVGNEIHDCDHGVAIEHGNNNFISNNSFKNSPSGIELWERAEQPEGWGFAEKRDVSSRAYTIDKNSFHDIGKAIVLTGTDSVFLRENSFDSVSEQVVLDGVSKTYSVYPGMNIPGIPNLPEPLPDGMNTELESEYPRGRKYMLINEWGPYNFAYPDIFLRRIDQDNNAPFDHTFALFGPTGNWKLLPGASGIVAFRPKSGTTPTTIELKQSADSSSISFQLEYLGPDFVDQFGDTVSRGEAPLIQYQEISPAEAIQ